MTWIIWIVLAGIVVVLEMFTGTFYLLMVGIGLAAGALAAFAGAGGTLQFILAAVVGIVATYALRRGKFGKASRFDAARDPNVNLDIGQTLMVGEWHHFGAERYTARASYRGAMWDVELQQGGVAQPGVFVIREVKGSRLVVANSGPENN
jgi:membrane protein implicated in regulation of membrane protease activity